MTEILRTTREENLAMIEDSTRYLVAQGREVIYDAEHFFDGYKADSEYALQTLAAAMRGGASNLSLCDTNGGTLVDEFKDIVGRAVKEFGGEKVGVHCHNDSGLGVALTLAGVAAGATLVQGTANGYGERVGNANITTVLPNLLLKMGRTANCAPNLSQLRDLSLFFDELANLRPDAEGALRRPVGVRPQRRPPRQCRAKSRAQLRAHRSVAGRKSHPRAGVRHGRPHERFAEGEGTRHRAG